MISDKTRQPVLTATGDDLSSRAGLAGAGVPDTVVLPDYDPWGGAGCFGMLEMDMHRVLLERYIELADQAGMGVFVLAPNPAWQVEPDTYPVVPYTGQDLDPIEVPGLLVLTPAGLREAADVWDVYAGGPQTSESGWADAALLV